MRTLRHFLREKKNTGKYSKNDLSKVQSVRNVRLIDRIRLYTEIVKHYYTASKSVLEGAKIEKPISVKPILNLYFNLNRINVFTVFENGFSENIVMLLLKSVVVLWKYIFFYFDSACFSGNYYEKSIELFFHFYVRKLFGFKILY